jgi:hypothetical protein
MSYAHQKLKHAVETLLGDRSAKRQWLEGKEVYHVFQLSQEEFPHDAREDFSQLQSDSLVKRMKKSLNDQINLARAISEADVERLTTRIIELYYHVDAAMFSRVHQPRRTPQRNDNASRDTQP